MSNSSSKYCAVCVIFIKMNRIEVFRYVGERFYVLVANRVFFFDAFSDTELFNCFAGTRAFHVM